MEYLVKLSKKMRLVQQTKGISRFESELKPYVQNSRIQKLNFKSKYTRTKERERVKN